MRAVRELAVALTGLGIVLLVWWAVTETGLISRAFLPSPDAALAALQRGLARDLLAQTGATVILMFQGWLLASLVAIILGALIGLNQTARETLEPLLEFIRPLPASAIIPIAIAVFGLTPGMVLSVVAFGSLWPTLLATVHGFKSVEPRLVEVSRALGLSRLSFVWKIGLPNAVPDVLAGMRLSLTVALILAIVTEMLAGQQGLGTAILLAGRSFRAADIFAGLILLGLIGLISNLVLEAIEQRLLRWRAA
ncbi:ABC transporter permease [Roseomonas sp. KE2513]|uniref:ABC transporter permease n=1 Tax=Roseomonas sp. KE2513 TaxID=2479202 RepID=UPI0018E01746|nr:ABC transporter permease [Roseomonas sp. KE2513]MBI0538787.1 ABC transporter permease [Roseomonas sp. KE2513]